MLLIHGFASSAKYNWIEPGWVSFLTRNGFRVVAIDNRGHGESDKLYDRALYTAPLMAEDARRLMDHLAIPRADVMGYSMGARITAFLALAHPERVRSAIFGGLGGNMVRPMAGTGPIAAALEATSIDDVKNPTARTFRAFRRADRQRPQGAGGMHSRIARSHHSRDGSESDVPRPGRRRYRGRDRRTVRGTGVA